MAFESFNINFDYKQQATAESFNILNHKLQPNGVYEGFDVAKVSDTEVTVGTGICYIEDSANSLSCRAELTSSDNLTVSSATPFIIIRFTWVNTETNIPSVLAVDFGSINDTDIIVGECIYESTTLTEINTNRKEIASVQDLENNKDAFHVYATQPASDDISIIGGSTVINGKLVTITDTTFEVTNGTTSGRNDIIYLDDTGTINILEGTDSGSPVTPTYPSNVMVLCEIHRGASKSIVKNNEIVQIANKKDIVYGETVVTNIDKNFVGVIQSIQSGKLTSNEPDYLSESSGIITLNGSTTPFRCNIGDGFSDYGKKAYRINIKDDSNTIDLSGEADDDYYIILDYNTSTGATSLEAITVPRIMSTIEPSHATNQLWYNINDNKMFESDGSSWTQTHKLVLGMINKSGATYTIYNRSFNDIPTHIVAQPSSTFSISSSTWGGSPMTVPLSEKSIDYNNEFDTTTYTFTAKRDMEVEIYGVFSASTTNSYILSYLLNGVKYGIINETSALTLSGTKFVSLKTGDTLRLGAESFSTVTGDTSFCMKIKEISWRN